jgi:hypothetical protein
MRVILRKYHRWLAIALCLPLFVTAISGISLAIADKWLQQEDVVGFLLKVHTFELFGLAAILPVLNGVGLFGLLTTGLSMTGIFSKRRPIKRAGGRL